MNAEILASSTGSVENWDTFMKRLCQVTRLVEAALGRGRQTSSGRAQLSHPAGWARERVARRPPRRQASFAHPAVARWFTLLCALSIAQHVPAHDRNPTEESRSLRDGSQ